MGIDGRKIIHQGRLGYNFCAMTYSTIFFDLDDTLYPPSSGVWDAIGDRIDLFIHKRLGIPMEDVPELRETLYRTYGTTLRGLTVTRGIDQLDYLAFVHDIPLDNYLTPDDKVKAVLARYPQRKVIFTNADRAHAERVLNVLLLRDYFDQIIDILDVSPYCKPMPEAFHLALKSAGQLDAQDCIMIDDAAHNLRAARSAGFFTVRVGSTQADGCCDAAAPSLLDLPSVLDPLLIPRGGS